MKDSFSSRVMSYLSRHELLNWMGDELFMKVRFWVVKHRILDLNNPRSFNEKIQWLKLYDRNEDYINFVDKWEVKKYIGDRIGNQYLIPTLGGPWKSVHEIDWDILPEKFVLKCTHNSGTGVAIVTEKSEQVMQRITQQFAKCMKENFFYAEREWPYKHVVPRIMAEELIEDTKSHQLMDYKVHVFNGVARIIQVDFDRYSGHKRNLYDREWNYIEAMIEYPTHPEIQIDKPEKLDELLQLAEKIAGTIPYIRVDFYIANGKIYFGEMTFYHGGGLELIEPYELDLKMGEWICLPERGRYERTSSSCI